MAARKTNKTTTAAPTTTKSKADAIRDWFESNPEGTATQCAKALAEQGIEVGSGHCQQILNKRRGGSSGGKVDVAQIKLAAEFVEANGGDVENAVASIEYVGGFITKCGNAAKAKAALEAYQSVAALLK